MTNNHPLFFHAVDVKHLFVLHFMPRLCEHAIVGRLQSKELLLKCVVVLGENKTPNQLSQNGQFGCVGIAGGGHDLLLVLLVVMLLVVRAACSVWSSKEVCTIVGLCP